MNRPKAGNDGGALESKIPVLPPSCANGWVALSGVAGFLLSLVLMYDSGIAPVHRSLIALAAAILPMFLLDLLVLRVHRRSSTGLVWPAARSLDPVDRSAIARVLVKLLGLTATVSALAVCYWLFPVYQDRFYWPYWSALRDAGPWLAIASVPYFFYIDRHMASPYDGYWHAGMAVIGQFERVEGAVLWQHALGWVIKGFFLPLMFVYLTHIISAILATTYVDGFLSFYRLVWNFSFAIDLLFATLGYCLTLRIIDSQIRSADSTFFGWAVAVICYQPFSGLLFHRYLDYRSDSSWVEWLNGSPTLQLLWGMVIVVLLTIHAWSILVFGSRFSNLTHRGILTHGPFRWTKHPSYLSKNLMWWMISVPFISSAGFADGIRSCLLLLGVNAIYFLRAKAEERHLSCDPDYVAYANWIEQRGVLRWIGRICPLLRYKEKVHKSDLR